MFNFVEALVWIDESEPLTAAVAEESFCQVVFQCCTCLADGMYFVNVHISDSQEVVVYF